MLEVSTLWKDGMKALDQGQPDLAEAMQRRALSIVLGLGGFAVLEARIRNNLGVILSCGGRGAEAEQEFARALFLLQGRVDPQTRFHQVISGNHRKTKMLEAAL